MGLGAIFNLPVMRKYEQFSSYILRTSYVNDMNVEDFRAVADIKEKDGFHYEENYNQIAKSLKIDETPVELYKNHTDYKLSRYYTTKTQQTYVFETLENGERNKDIFYTTKQYACPICAKEDLENYGTYVKYTYHNYLSVNACFKHGCRLEKLDYNRGDVNYIAHFDTEYVEPESDQEVKYAKFVYDIGNLDVDACKEKSLHILSDEIRTHHEYLTSKNIAEAAKSAIYEIYTKGTEHVFIRNSDILWLMFLFFGDRIDEFEAKYKALG